MRGRSVAGVDRPPPKGRPGAWTANPALLHRRRGAALRRRRSQPAARGRRRGQGAYDQAAALILRSIGWALRPGHDRSNGPSCGHRIRRAATAGSMPPPEFHMLATPTDGRRGVTPVCSAATTTESTQDSDPVARRAVDCDPRVGPSRWQSLGEGTDAEAEGADRRPAWNGTT